MLAAGGDGVGRAQVVGLVAAHQRAAEHAVQIGVLAESLVDAPPAEVAGGVEHRREGPAHAGRGGLDGGDAPDQLDQFLIPRPGERQLGRKDGAAVPEAVPVNRVDAEQDRDAEPRLLGFRL